MNKIFFGIVFYVFSVCVVSSSYAGSVNVVVREQYGVDRISAPVTAGIPLPYGDIFNVSNMRLLDGVTPIPAQFRVLTRWNGGAKDVSKYIQWVLVDFQATVPANMSKYYKLEFGASVQNYAIAAPVVTTETAEDISIDTGTAIFKISKKKFDLFDSVKIAGREFIRPSLNEGFIIKDTFGNSYNAANNTKSVTLEEDGPVRSVVLVRGAHANNLGSEKEFYGYTTRLFFYKGKSTVRVVHTLENRPWDARGALAFSDYSLKLSLELAEGSKTYMVYGESEKRGNIAPEENISIYQDSDGGDHWNNSTVNELYKHTSFRGYKIYRNGVAEEQKNHALGIIDLSDAVQGVAVGVHQFWQRFPKSLSVDGNGILDVGILPDNFDYTFFLEDMSSLNTELYLNFHSTPYNGKVRDEIVDRLHPMIAVPDPVSWYSTVGGETLPDDTISYYPNGVTPRLLQEPYTWSKVDLVQQPLINVQNSLYDTRSAGYYSAFFYGIRNGGDKNGSNFEGPVEHFVNFMQTGQTGASGDKYWYYNSDNLNDPLYRDYDLFWGGVDFVQHWMYSRTSNLPQGWTCEKAGITNRSGTKGYFFWDFYPQFGGRIGSDPVYTLPTLLPMLSDGKGHTQPSHGWPNMDYSHVTLNHVVDYYKLTGDMAVLDYAHSEGEILKNMLISDVRDNGIFDNPPNIAPQYYAMRGIAWPILGLTMMYEITGENQYLNYAEESAKIFNSAQDKERGFFRATDPMSLGQYSKMALALAELYKITHNEQYRDLIEGYTNWITDYLIADNYYLNGYYLPDNLGVNQSYQGAVQFYDSYHHQPSDQLTGLGSSDTRLYYILSWMYLHSGNSKYVNVLNANYNYGNGGKATAGFLATSPWTQLYLSMRFNHIRQDNIRPGQITNIKQSTTSVPGEIKIEWIAPHDDKGVVKYQVKYAEKPIVEQIIYPDDAGLKVNFWAANNVEGEPLPSEEGAVESMIIRGLDPAKRYYFAIRAFDAASNSSPVEQSTTRPLIKKISVQ